MLISGYVFTLSYKYNGVTDLKNCYNLNLFKKRIKRIYIPFLAIYSLEILLSNIFLSENLDISFILKNLILGGFGPGSYYPVIMFQFLFIIPIIYIVSYKKLNYSIPVFFTVDVLFELFTCVSGMSEGIYRLLIGRYIFVIVLGSYLALNQNKMNKKLLYGGAILSIIYMYASVYLNYHAFGHDFWAPHNAPAYFYTAFLFVAGMNLFPENPRFVLAAIAELGKASWHIFLIQMLYFWTIGLHSDSIFAVAVNIIICVTLGYLFYVFEINIHTRRMRQDDTKIINSLLSAGRH